MKKIIYIAFIFLVILSCNNESEPKISINKIDDKNPYPQSVNENASKTPVQKTDTFQSVNENASKTPVQKTDTLDSLIILFFPNADKDSLIASVDSAIYSFLNEVQPPLNEEVKKKLEKEKHELYQKINDEEYNWGPNGFNEESWKQNYLFEYVELGDAEDGRIFNQAVYPLFVRLAKVSLEKKRSLFKSNS